MSTPTPEDEVQNTLSSRDSSFFSLASGNSVYFSAKETLNSTANENGDGENPSKAAIPTSGQGHVDKENLHLSTKDDGNSISDIPTPSSVASSATLEEAESMSSFSDAADYYSSGNGEMEEGTSIKRSPSTSSVEVKKDISRLCSSIAKADALDKSKKRDIEEALLSKDTQALRKLAVSTGGLLSSKI